MKSAPFAPKATRWRGIIFAFLAVTCLAGLAHAMQADDAMDAASEAVDAMADVAAEAAETAEEAAAEVPEPTPFFNLSNLWLLIAAALVFVMHLGFAMLECGLTRAKNAVNILFKNTAIISIGLLTYAIIGFNLMYAGYGAPGDPDAWYIVNIISKFGFWVGTDAAGVSPAYGDYTYWTDFIFQGMFAATAATIVSGAVAERIKLLPFLIFSTIFVAIVYPIYGSWQWGSGWLSEGGFHDFAGSTIVHSVGGWGALAGVIVLGPRLGKYVTVNGTSAIRPIVGHNLPLATIGAFLLWFGWFGFNGGSVLNADAAGTSLVFVTTALGAAAGIFTAMVVSWVVQQKPDLTMALNGALAGLVGITAGADVITPFEAVIMGGIAGIIVVFSVIGLDRLKLDDPVGAISVHLVCGIWGTLAVGIFGEGKDLVWQIYGVVAAAALCFPSALIIFAALKYTIGLRVSREEELGGLDVGEHAMEAYGGFQIYPDQ